MRLSALEYESAEDPYLVFRPDTALWQTTNAIAPFVHGGNSLEERVIPVLVLATAPPPARLAEASPEWATLIADEGYRRVVTVLAERRSINEAELAEVLGSPRRVRAFAREYDALVRLLPFDVELRTVNGLKTYARKD